MRSFVGIVREYTLRMSLDFYSSATQSSDLQHIVPAKEAMSTHGSVETKHSGHSFIASGWRES